MIPAGRAAACLAPSFHLMSLPVPGPCPGPPATKLLLILPRSIGRKGGTDIDRETEKESHHFRVISLLECARLFSARADQIS